MPESTLDDLLRKYLLEKLGKNATETASSPQLPDKPIDVAIEAGSTAEFGTSLQTKRDLLTAIFQRFQAKDTFQPGQHVKWKSGLRNRLLPDEGDPAVVIEILAQPILDPTQDTGSPYFQESLDLRLGMLDEKGELQVYFYDSRRFEAF